MRFIDFLLELDDIGTRVQGLGGSISGNVPNVLPSGTFDQVNKKAKRKRKKNAASKDTAK